MKFSNYILITAIIFGCEVDNQYRWEKQESYQNVLSKSKGKIIILDFETEWCGWCKKLDEITFNDKFVIDYANNQFLSIKVDAEKGEGITLAKKYNVTGYPTILFIDEKENEIDRILGYKDPIPYLSELKRIRSGKNTLPALLNSFQTNPKNFSTLFKLAKKYEAMGEFESATKMIDAILVGNIDSAETGKFFEILYDSRKTGNPGRLLNYINETAQKGYISSAIQEAMNLVRKDGKNPSLEASLFLKLINLAGSNSPSMLNSFAWRMSELEINLDLALEKINIAIDIVDDKEQKHMFIDTKAEILWKQNRVDNAIYEIKKCISAFPENVYYKEQLLKFQKSIDI